MDATLGVSWDTMVEFMIDAASGLTCLHKQKSPIIHEDLQTSRLLVDAKWRVKVGFYGFVDLRASLRGLPVQPTLYSAPEVLEDPRALSTAANVYSFSIIMVEIFARVSAWSVFGATDSLTSQIKAGRRPTIPSSLSPRFKKLIRSCWSGDPNTRPSMEEVLAELKELLKLGPAAVVLKEGENAKRYQKIVVVSAYKSKDPITIIKDWGKSKGKPGWYVVCGDKDDVYVPLTQSITQHHRALTNVPLGTASTRRSLRRRTCPWATPRTTCTDARAPSWPVS
jgi:serine/threonine protein kinase